MKEYIEREAAIRVLCGLCLADGKCGHTCKEITALEALPAADVQEVVLCRDCKYCPTGTDNGEEQGFGLEFPYKETYKCPFMCDDGWYSRKPRPDFFCANGERNAE